MGLLDAMRRGIRYSYYQFPTNRKFLNSINIDLAVAGDSEVEKRGGWLK